MQAIRVRKGNIFTLLVGMQTGIAIMEVSQKGKNRTHVVQQSHSWVYIPQKQKHNLKMPQCSLFIIAKIWKQPNRKQHKASLNRWMDKDFTDRHTHTHTVKYYSTIKKEWHFATCSNKDGLGGHYAKWSELNKDK